MTSLGWRVRERRKALGLSQEALARQLVVSKNTVARWESGAQPRGVRLSRLASALRVSADWLLTGDIAA
jgi:transcriptional regulator with XRE-family HTH domain